MRRLVKGVLSLILPEDPSVTLTSPPEVEVIKGWKKKNSAKRDKSHWEHVSIAHQKIQKSSRSVFGSGSGSGSLSDCHELLGEGAKGATVAENVIGDGNRGYRVMADFVFGDEHQWSEVHRRMLYELEHSTNVYLNLVGSAERDGPAPYEHWLEAPDSLYIIANVFDLYVILIAQLGSTTVLPLYSYSVRAGDTLVFVLLIEQQHFIHLQMYDGFPTPPLHVRWIHHRTERVSNWTD
ncbi:hypothetical protein M9H77_22956 [Catharanthus roseus]|uniref:Uncharacterized protein n=1 Tax=Catharanthus roseus TaxID=4058 RepID=A0ACC0AUM8_CATRO|nr:hypothetical protein M9H77_22956 [Catharanthus roseus]